MNTIQNWFIEVAAKKMVPSLIRAALAAGIGLLVAHAGLLAKVGINYDQTAQTITVHLGALQDWLMTAGLGLVTAILTMIQHHATQLVVSKQ